MSKVITTVTGDILPEQLGITSMHEHLFAKFDVYDELRKTLPPIPAEQIEVKPINMTFLRTGGVIYQREMYNVDDVDYVAEEVRAFQKFGGQSILDASSADLRNDIRLFRQLSDKTGVHVVVSTGAYRAAATPQRYLDMSDEALLELYKNEILKGIDGTDIKAGAVKSAIEEWNEDGTWISEREWRLVRIAAQAAAETGRLLQMHLSFTTMTPDMVYRVAKRVIEELGVKPEKFLICHLDCMAQAGLSAIDYIKNPYLTRTPNTELALRLLDMGINIGIEGWGLCISDLYPLVYSDNLDRLRFLYTLLERGYVEQIAWGQDTFGRVQAMQEGGYGMKYFLEIVPPRLRELGISETDISKLLSGAPARMLAHDI